MLGGSALRAIFILSLNLLLGLCVHVQATCGGEGENPTTASSRSAEFLDGSREWGRVAILGDDPSRGVPALAESLAQWLREDGFPVTVLSPQDACERSVLRADDYFLYVIPHCRTYPAAGFDVLMEFTARGGHVLLLGGPLLDDPLWWLADRWVNRHEVLTVKRTARAEHYPLSMDGDGARTWTRATNNFDGAASWDVVPEGPDGTACFRFQCQDLVGWEGWLSPPINALFGQGHDLMTFVAKGGPRTKQLVVELQEQDGSRWMAIADLTERWERVSLDPHDFQYWPDSTTRGARGGKGDRLRPDQARRVNFQLAQSHIPTLPRGAHQFWIADVGTGASPTRDLPMADSLPDQSLETIYPRYKVFPLERAARLESSPEQSAVVSMFGANDVEVRATHMQCAIPRTMGRGFQRGQKWRYVPLLDAVDGEGNVLGSPGWLLLAHASSRPTSVTAGLGVLDPDLLASRELAQAVCAIAGRLRGGLFLREAGAEQFAYWPGESVRLGATVTSVSPARERAALKITVRGADGQVAWENSAFVPELERGREHQWSDTWTPPARPGAVYTVTTQLLSGDTVIDQIGHDVSLLDTRRPDPSEYISVSGNDFILQGRKWYPVGINYWPLYVSGMDQDDFWAGWLRSAYYDPELVEEDLARMAELGINLVSIQSSDLQDYRNLLDFIRRCDRRNIYVNLFCGLASPLAFREEPLREFIETARLADNPAIMAYDTIWEPGNYVFQGDRRGGWDGAWRAWVIEQYGSIEAAEADWQFAGRRDDQQRLISPPDQHFQQDGPWRVMMAAYRRFMDDLTSRQWNQAHRKLREIDPHHLVSFRQGNTLPHDFVFTGTPKHVDFICPEGYSIPHSDAGYHAAGFITKYVHFTTGGKPVVWSEFGQSVWDPTTMSPSPARIEEVARYHELFYRMALESGANGTIPWWWPGGYRVGERSDYGIIDPNGAPRPAAQLIAHYGPRLRADRSWPAPTVWYDMDRDAHAGGYWHVCFHAGADAYRRASESGEHLGVRSAGTGTTSATVPRVAVGNRPPNGSNPPKYLNAEFNWLLVQDASGSWVEATQGVSIPVRVGVPILARISIGNTQEARWLAPTSDVVANGTVVLQTTDSSQVRGRWSLPEDTPYLADADFGELTLAQRVSEPLRVELRMMAVGFTEFGEKRAFTLSPVQETQHP